MGLLGNKNKDVPAPDATAPAPDVNAPAPDATAPVTEPNAPTGDPVAAPAPAVLGPDDVRNVSKHIRGIGKHYVGPGLKVTLTDREQSADKLMARLATGVNAGNLEVGTGLAKKVKAILKERADRG